MNNLALDDATLTLVREYQTLEYLRVIVVTLFFYDYLACLKREINNIWGGKWTALNVLYILTRYIPFFNFIDMFMTFFLDQQILLAVIPVWHVELVDRNSHGGSVLLPTSLRALGDVTECSNLSRHIVHCELNKVFFRAFHSPDPVVKI
ncbi:hypothetical protein NP233_g10590 [Leucocoprinus birnbaumii]|uniref:DUF6533 domain-containing protein n=1 Tax=Leucocoprinus birnbaumii TaxID=56174 RepID=A0AAD5VLN6_9AGAR|nr:hypothetical protein NP233_g10590 [Leucocoprinus birnbaumii]